MKKFLKITSCVGLACAFFNAFIVAKTVKPAKAGYDMETVMKKGFKGSEENPALLKKIVAGKVTAQEKKLFAAYVDALVHLKPKLGGADRWKEKTAALVAAVKSGKVEAIKKASDCKACHNVHKYKKKQ